MEYPHLKNQFNFYDNTPSANPASHLIRKIFSLADLNHWQKTPGYNDLKNFILILNSHATRQHDGFSNVNLIQNARLIELKNLLKSLSSKIDSIKPLADDKNQRFGNQAYRTWFDEMKSQLDTYFSQFDEETATELRPYLEDSFGNRQRIDYGTGHELNFIIYLLGLFKLDLKPATDNPEAVKQINHQFLSIFGYFYLPLCRKFQIAYRLEPAGSHGVFSLDDFQYLPFLFGSAEMIDHPTLKPSTFTEESVARAFSDQYMFYAAIDFIFKVKNGPFFEHSNQLWNISGCPSWDNVNRGLSKKYFEEVLHKFPIVQHLQFGKKVLQWQ